MKKLTENQQAIIDSLTTEFNRINNQNNSPKQFNLIDISHLEEKTKEIRRNNAEAEAIKKYWLQLAMDEAERVAALLQADLPMACVERFGRGNGKVDAPSVIIQRKRGICGHHENYVSFDIELKFGGYVQQSHGCGYQEIVGLVYKYYNTPSKSTKYDSVEELFAMSDIAEEIRKKIIR